MSVMSESERLGASVRAVVGDATARAAFITQRAKALREMQRRSVQAYDGAMSVLLACLEGFDVVQGNPMDVLCALTLLSILLSLDLSAFQLLQYNSYLHLCLNAVSTVPVAIAAARTFGETLRHSMTTEFVRTQTDMALERVALSEQPAVTTPTTATTPAALTRQQQQQQQQARRVCGVLVLTEVVLRAPMLILPRLADVFARLWGTLASGDADVRSRGLRLFGLCTKVLGDRPPAARQDVYEQLYAQLRAHLTSSRLEQRVAGLLAFEPLASNSAAYATPDMRERLAALLRPFLDAAALDNADVGGDDKGSTTTTTTTSATMRAARDDDGGDSSKTRPTSPRFSSMLLQHHHVYLRSSNNNNNNSSSRRSDTTETARIISTMTMLQLVYADRPLLFHALVVLCRYDAALFVQHYLADVVRLALAAIRRDVQRAAAFDLLSELLQLAGADAFVPYAADASAAARAVFASTTATRSRAPTPRQARPPPSSSPSSSSQGPCWEALRLYALLFSLCPLPDMEASMDVSLERVFRWGISAQLIESMRVIIAASSEAYRGRLAELLLDMISLTLCGLPFRQQQQQQQPPPQGGARDDNGTTTTARHVATLTSSFASDTDDSTLMCVTEHDATVALSALMEFGYLNTELMGDFLRDAVLPFIDSASATVRNAATSTIVHLLLPPGPKESLSVSRRVCVHTVLTRMLSVALTDANADVRETLLTSFTADFRAYLCEPPFLQQLCNALGDEAIRCRVAALEQLCALVPYDPSHILPVLREQAIVALRLVESAFNTDTVCQGLQLLSAIAERAPAFVVSFVAGVWQALSPYFAAMYPGSPLLLSFLQCCAAVASAVQSFAPGAVDFGAHVSTVCGLLDAMPVERGTHAARLACLSFLATTLRPLMPRSSNGNATATTAAAGAGSGQGGAVVVVESPYKLHPRLFRLLAGIVRRSDDSEDVRLAALRCLGIVGALDPYLFSAFAAAAAAADDNGDVVDGGAAVAMARVTQSACGAAVLHAIVDMLTLGSDGATAHGAGGATTSGNNNGNNSNGSAAAAVAAGSWADGVLAPSQTSQLQPQARSTAQRDVLVRYSLQTILTIADLCPSSRGELKHVVGPLARVLADCAVTTSNNNNNNNNGSNGVVGGGSGNRAMAVMLFDFVSLVRLVGADAMSASPSNASDLLGLFLRVWEHCVEHRFLAVRLLSVLTHAEAAATASVDVRVLIKRHMPVVPLLLDTLRAHTSGGSGAAAAAAGMTAPLELQYAVLSYIVQHARTLQGYCEPIVMGLLHTIDHGNRHGGSCDAATTAAADASRSLPLSTTAAATPSELVDAAVVTLRVVCASLSVDEYAGAIVRVLCVHLVATAVAMSSAAASATTTAAATTATTTGAGAAGTAGTAAAAMYKSERRLPTSASNAALTSAVASPTSSMQAAFLTSSLSAAAAAAASVVVGGMAGASSSSMAPGGGNNNNNNNGSQWPSHGGYGGSHVRTTSLSGATTTTSTTAAASTAAVGGGKVPPGAGVVRGETFVQHILSIFAVLLTTLQDDFVSYAGRVVHLLNNYAISGTEFEQLYRRAVGGGGGAGGGRACAFAPVTRARRVLRGERAEVAALLRLCETVALRAMPRTADAFVYANVNDDSGTDKQRRRRHHGNGDGGHALGNDDDDDDESDQANDAPLPHTSSLTLLTATLNSSSSSSSSALLSSTAVEERVLAVNEARVVAALRTLPLTREEWLKWFEQLARLVLQESPYQVFRCTALPLGVMATPLAEREPAFALRVLPVAFRALCAHASTTLRGAAGECLRLIFRQATSAASTVPDEVLVALLGLVEHMDHAGETLALAPQALSDCAWSRGMLAKALYWREAAYRVDAAATVESLMSLYSELHMVDAAVGVLAQTASEEQRRSLLQASLVKLARYDEALALTRQALAHDDTAHDVDDDVDDQQQPSLHTTSGGGGGGDEAKPRNRGSNHHNASLARCVDGGGVDGRWSCHVRLMLCLSELGEYAQVLDEWSRLHDRFALCQQQLLQHNNNNNVSSSALLLLPGNSSAAAAAAAESDEGSLLHHVAHYAADAAMRMQAYDTLEQALAWVPQHTLPHAIGEAVLCIVDRDYDAAQVAVRAGQLLLLDELSGLLHESYSRAYDGLVAAQQLTELEETVRARRVEVAFDTTAHLAAVSRLWEQRIRMMTPSVRVWKRVLATRSLLIAPPDDVKTRIRFVKLCRREGATQLQKFTLDELLGNHYPTVATTAAADNNNNNSSNNATMTTAARRHRHDVTYDELTSRAINPRVALQYVKYLAASNAFGADTTFGLERDFVKTLINVHSRSDNGVMLARAYVRLGTKSDGADEAVQYYKAATEHDPLWNVGWRLWAEANVDLLAAHAGGYVHEACLSAIRGYIRSIQLATSQASIIQDVLKLLTLWSRHGDTERGLRALRAHVLELPARVWHLVVPQLVARLDSGSDESCHLVADVLLRVAYEYPHTLIYPLNLCTESDSARRRGWAGEVLGRLQARYPALVVQGRRMIRELVRVAALVHERWFDALESAASAFFARQSVGAMRRTLLPMHDALLRPPETVLEAQFLFRYSARLSAAQDWLLSYTATRNIADVHAAWQLYHDVYKAIDAEQKLATVLCLQYCSPALFEARDLALGIPDARPTGDVGEAAGAVRSTATTTTTATTTMATDTPAVSRIAYFLDELHVIPSKQRPKRLAVVTRTGRTQKFLLKGREDLRLDERVMQLFGLVNILMLSDTRSSKNAGFQIQRYSVTPLSDSAGLIGWVDGCDTLHELVKRHREYRGVPVELEMRMLNQIIALDHVKAYDCLSVMSKVEVMEFLAARTSGQDMRKAMWVTAPTCEAWLERRWLYVTSLANMSMVGYILGLGDRHPNNIMLQRATGLVVHIDFGDCFEVAMTRDKFPEKVPFRLTRMLASALDVSGVHGAFRATCETSMRVLRENSHSVLALLEAFLQDPLISWRLVNRPGQEPESLSNHKAMAEQVKAAVAAATGAGGGGSGSTTAHGRSQLSTVAMAAAAAAAAAATTTTVSGAGATTATSPSAMAHAGESYTGAGAGGGSSSLAPTDAAAGRRETAGNSHSVVRHLFGEEVDVVHQGVLILKRLSSKLDGMDFIAPAGPQTLDAPTQVRRLIDEATDQINIAQSWSGWYPFW